MPSHEERLQELERQAAISNHRLDRVEALLLKTAEATHTVTSLVQRLVEANNTNALAIRTLGEKIDQLVDALLHPAGSRIYAGT
ncbi:MAG TPA: hypothetical protein VEV17_13455 [Bryobacteraceae bacterium]|nr:hypothetical protein [Bryobacteraceae bacterium]